MGTERRANADGRKGGVAGRAQEAAGLEAVRMALAEAHDAAAKAVESFLKGADIGDDGFVRDTCGNSVLWVRKPSYQFRKALKTLGELRKWPGAEWEVSSFSRHTKGAANQSYQAHRLACEAAIAVLSKRFSDEVFSIHSWVD